MGGARTSIGLAIAGALAVVISIGAGEAEARPGDLDPTFGTGGIVGSPSPPPPWRGVQYRHERSNAQPLGELTDGSVVIAGSYSVSAGCRLFPCKVDEDGFMAERIRPDGARDPAFGEEGRVVTTFGLVGVDFDQAALEPGGGLVVLGMTVDTAYVFRLEPDGTRDENYAGDGRAEIQAPPGTQFSAGDIALQSDRSAVIATSSAPDRNATSERKLIRLSPAGEVDPSFPSQPAAKASGHDTGIGSMIVDSQDRILIGVHSLGPAWPDLLRPHAVLRFTPEGAPDEDFGSQGLTELAPSESGFDFRAPRLAVDAQDRVFVLWAGQFVARLTPDGTQDQSFGSGGVVDLLELMRSPSDIALQPDGKVLLTGAVYHPKYGDTGLALGRLLQDGRPDTTFGVAGFSKVYPPIDASSPSLLLVDPGFVLSAGGQEDGDGIAAARFRLGGGLPDDLDADGVLDPGDRCPGRYEPGSGCPRYERTITVEREGLRTVTGEFSAEYLGCIRDVRVAFKAKRRGRDKVVGRLAPSWRRTPIGYETSLWKRARGPVYATVKRTFDPKSGVCRPARSRAARPGRD